MFLRGKSTIFLIILALILVAGGVWYTQKPAPQTPPVVNDNGERFVDKTENGLSGGGIDISDWTEYNNKSLGISFRYPNQWKIVEWPNNKFVLLKPGESPGAEYAGETILTIYNNPEELSIEQFANRDNKIVWYRDSAGGFNEFNVEDKSGVYFKDILGIVTVNAMVLKLDDKIVELEFDYKQDEQIYKKIIETINQT